MKKIITFKDFFYEFRKIINEKYESSVLKKAVYSNLPKYTLFINGTMKNEVTKMLQEKDASIEHYSEYYRIDHTWWTVDNPDDKHNVKLFNWEFLLAIEHENNPKDWTNEVAKLDYIKAPLKIVIGYADNDKRDDDIAKIKEQKKLLKRLNVDNNSEEEFGVILLNKKINHSNNNPFDIRGYLIVKDDEPIPFD